MLTHRLFPKKAIAVLAALTLLFGALTPFPALAQKSSMPLIRDAEVEESLKIMLQPLLNASGIDRESLRVFIVQNDELNAFVAGGQNLFLHTGLLIRAENHEQIMGVMAHELGHIAGGHLSRHSEVMDNLSVESIITHLLAVAAFALGKGDAGAAVIAGGAHLLQSKFLAYSRTQERSADQAALSYLKQSGVSAKGLYEFFGILQQQQKALLDPQSSPYTLSHPLSSDRMQAVESFMRSTPQQAENKAYTTAFARMRAKLIGHLRGQDYVQFAYPASDQSVWARYARSIAAYKKGDFDSAIKELDILCGENPQDAFFLEQRGQIYFEHGHIAESIRDYSAALELAPHQALIRMGLAQSLLQAEDKSGWQSAAAHLTEVLRLEPRYAPAWRLEAVAQGKLGHIGLSALALAEMALLRGDRVESEKQANRAIALLPQDAPGRKRAEDIKNQLQLDKEKN